MQFIVEQQAQFASDIQELKEGLRELKEGLRETNRIMAQGFDRVTAIQMQMATAVRELAELQRQDRLDIKENRADIKALEANMNALIKVVDDLVRRDGGRPQ